MKRTMLGKKSKDLSEGRKDFFFGKSAPNAFSIIKEWFQNYGLFLLLKLQDKNLTIRP